MAENAEALQLVLNELQKRCQRKESLMVLRDASNPFELPEETFRQMYRLTIPAARDFFEEIVQHIPLGVRKTRIPPIVRFFTTLHFLAHGSYQKPIGNDQFNSMSQPAVSRAIKEIVEIIVQHLTNRYVRFPQTAEEMQNIKNGFYRKYNFPGIIGCIDCTHIKLVLPNFADLEYPPNVFINRKNFCSINCQIICDVNMKILNVNARYPGSVHDAAIWRTSNIKMLLHQNFLNGDRSTYLLGDSGYPLQPYLLTPAVGAEPGTPEYEYTRQHQSIRNVVERFNGVFKGIWRCLNSGRVLHYKPTAVAKIIYACATLHNFMLARNIVNEELFHEIENFNEPGNEHFNDLGNENRGENDAYLLRWGNIVRNRIIRDMF